MTHKGSKSKYPYKKQHPAKAGKQTNSTITDNKNDTEAGVKNTEEKTIPEKTVEPVEKLPEETEKVEKVVPQVDVVAEGTHEEFLKAAQDSLSPDDVVHLEINPNTILQNPIIARKIENDYTTQGIKGPSDSSSSDDSEEKVDNLNQDGNNSEAKEGNDTTSETTSDPDIDDMQPPVIPAEDEAKTQSTESKAGDDTAGAAANVFGIKTESAEEMVDFAFGAANYGIEKFAGKLTDIPIRPQFFRIEGVVAKIEDHNRKNVEKLIFTPQEIGMIKPPLVALMKEKGIEGFSNSEKLIAAIAMVSVNKIRVVIEIKNLNKKISSDLSQKIKESDDRMNERMKEMEERLRADFIKNNSEKGEDKKAA